MSRLNQALNDLGFKTRINEDPFTVPQAASALAALDVAESILGLADAGTVDAAATVDGVDATIEEAKP
jgi:hypothetical protein